MKGNPSAYKKGSKLGYRKALFFAVIFCFFGFLKFYLECSEIVLKKDKKLYETTNFLMYPRASTTNQYNRCLFEE